MATRETIIAKKRAERTAKAQARAKAKVDARARRARRLGKKPTSSGVPKKAGEAIGNLAGNFFSRLSGQRADFNQNRKKTTSATRRTRSPSLPTSNVAAASRSRITNRQTKPSSRTINAFNAFRAAEKKKIKGKRASASRPASRRRLR